jgi:gamma-glutamyl-gamma-aminobutyrate hydrolase PuuD
VPPLIGVSSWRGLAVTDDLEVNHVLTHASYVRAVEKAGGLPVVIPELEPEQVDALLDRLDGVVLVGGPDVDPSHYGEDRLGTTIPAEPSRDAFDLALARRCVERDHPLLAICRGIQILNVALGGSLVQHVPEHMALDRWNEDRHPVDLAPDSAIASIVGACRIGTNSLHHQTLDRLGSAVQVVGTADDGTPEAIQIDGAPHVIGVQWHPELLRHRPEHLALFSSLVRGS